MHARNFLTQPGFIPPLDGQFKPAVLANLAFRRALGSDGEPLMIALEREDGQISRFETAVFPDHHPLAEANPVYAERIFKFLLWQRGGFKAYIGGSPRIAAFLQACYAPAGPRRFDCQFMGQQVYEQLFQILACQPAEVPPANETGSPPVHNLEGCRIGFDLGASDRKVSAIIDGQVVYSEEVTWEPGKNADPEYHYTEIMKGLAAAARMLPRVDAIGGSSAGIYINNRPMVASLFRNVPPDRYPEIKNLFLRIRDELHVPLNVINDGDMAAMAGAMSLEDTGILGIAMGSSQAAGYVDPGGRILGWLNELSFAPLDYNPVAAVDVWSGDIGCGSTYLSQQAVFNLAPRAGITIPTAVPDTERLVFVQRKLESGHEGAVLIWQTIGIYLGYALAHYADFYDFKHAIIMGRCTSGCGGSLILEWASKVLQHEFPDLAARVHIQLPDEKSRRVGQSIAAASLPAL